jgi:hypothetical protein
MVGILGMVGGAVLGYRYGESQGPGCENACYFGSDAAMAGALVGWIGGAAIGAAAPSLGSSCTFGRRLVRGLGGSAVGFVGGAFATVIPVVGLVGLIGSPIGASIAQGRCA